MNDFEDQVGTTLASAAEGAPDAGGLAAGARRRHRVRRQRRIAVGGVAAALVVGVSAVALGVRGGDDRLAKDPAPTPSAPTVQTISSGDARAELPIGWKSFECAAEPEAQIIYAPADGRPCSDGLGAFWVMDELADLKIEPGGIIDDEGDNGVRYWQGNVTAGDHRLVVGTTSAELTRQILATARVDGQPMVDGSEWVTFDRSGLIYDVPAFWGVGEKGDRSGYAVCAGEDGDRTAELAPGDRSSVRLFNLYAATLGHEIRVLAPTEAVAQLVLATASESTNTSGDGSCVEEDFNVGLLPPESSGGAVVEESEPAYKEAEFDGIVMQVPADWSLKVDCGTVPEISADAGCTGSVDNDGVRFLEAATFRPAMAEGVVIQSGEGEEIVWVGYVLRGDWAVFITLRDKEQVEQLLGTVQR